MNDTAAPSPPRRHGQPGPPGAEGKRKRRRGGWLAAGVVVVVTAAAVAAWREGVFPAAAPRHGQAGQPAPATRPVLRLDITATTPLPATLGYAGSYTVTGQGGGTLTKLPRTGQVIRQGQALYRTGNGSPIVLLHGRVPDWRAMSEGVTGTDVSQLNHDLVRLGYADRAYVAAAGWNYYSAETAYGVQRLEGRLGVGYPSGSLSLGQVVFEPTAVRVVRLTGRLGGPASGPVLQATSDEHMVMISLDVSEQSQVRVGNHVTVTLPDGSTTPGTVSSVGKVATTSSGSNGSGSTTTVTVQVTLTHPGAAGTLDQAPVTVNVTTATARHVLAVPVTALLARSPGRYDVEVVGPGNARHYIAVTPGIFDDNSGLVQVTGRLRPGQRVVVASS